MKSAKLLDELEQKLAERKVLKDAVNNISILLLNAQTGAATEPDEYLMRVTPDLNAAIVNLHDLAN